MKLLTARRWFAGARGEEMMSRRAFAGLMGLTAAGLAGCAGGTDGGSARAGSVQAGEDSSTAAPTPQVTGDTHIFDVIDNPLFEGFGRLIFPTGFCEPTSDMTLADMPSILPWYSEIHTSTTVDIVNYLLAQRAAGKTVFYDIYSNEEKARYSSLADTGLFHFAAEGLEPGERAPFAVVCAGGGFAYVAAMHDSFPHCLHLARAGFNGFAIIYRPDAQLACEDLSRAVSFIFEHADELGVDTSGYSLWGGSAGARMAAYVGGWGTAAFGGDAVPQPATVVMQYTGHRELSGANPATYACVGDRDGIASWRTMQARQDALAAQGVPTEFHVYEGLRHGFGLGLDTVAEGWIDDAISFWQAQR